MRALSLADIRPPIWRRVQLPVMAGLGDLSRLLRDPSQDYPVCVAYKGDSPVEYWSEDDPGEPEPFDMAEVDRELAALGRSEE